jgi:hypothetical protein
MTVPVALSESNSAVASSRGRLLAPVNLFLTAAKKRRGMVPSKLPASHAAPEFDGFFVRNRPQTHVGVVVDTRNLGHGQTKSNCVCCFLSEQPPPRITTADSERARDDDADFRGASVRVPLWQIGLVLVGRVERWNWGRKAIRSWCVRQWWERPDTRPWNS